MKTGLFSIIALVVFFSCGQPGKKTPDNNPVENVAEDLSSMIRVEIPQPGQTISSPLTIKGQAVGNWYFEATFPIQIYNSEDKLLTESYATALSEWMTEEFVPFEVTLNFSAPGTREGKLVFEKANPSGLEENAKSYTVPVIFATQE